MALSFPSEIRSLSAPTLFGDLSNEALASLSRRWTLATCLPGRPFFMPGDRGEVLFWLKEGEVQLYRLGAGETKEASQILESGTIFGQMPFIGLTMGGCYAEARGPSRLYLLSRADIEQLLVERPRIRLGVLEAMGRTLVALERRVMDERAPDAAGRLAALLIRLADEQGSQTAVRGYPAGALAQALELDRRQTLETLRKMQAEGLIIVELNRLILRDRDGLTNLVRRVEQEQ